jgi:ATP-dependent Clp protease ATP-binding subunit ClpB
MHTLVGAGKADGAMDAANLLKPALARGELHCIGATTLDEYRKHVEKDAALARRFQPLMVEEPTVEDTISILRGIKEKYELHHGVRISDAALVAAATLSHRYITDRFLPDKAIDLMDEAVEPPADGGGFQARGTGRARPADPADADRGGGAEERRRRGLQGPAGEAGEGAVGPAAAIGGDDGEVAGGARQARGGADLQEKLDHARAELDQAKRAGDLAKAGELSYGVIPQLEKQLAEAEAQDSDVMVDEAVRPEQIAEVVARWTGVPVAKMLEGEKEKLLRMEEELGKRVIGQRQAVDAVAVPCGARVRGCRTRTVRWAPSCSSARPASARRS